MKPHARSWYVGLFLVLCAGCGSSEPAFQVANLRYVQLLRTAISAREPEKVDRVIASAQEQQRSAALSADEMSVLMEISLTAKGGAWDEAEQACFQLEQGQQWRRR